MCLCNPLHQWLDISVTHKVSPISLIGEGRLTFYHIYPLYSIKLTGFLQTRPYRTAWNASLLDDQGDPVQLYCILYTVILLPDQYDGFQLREFQYGRNPNRRVFVDSFRLLPHVEKHNVLF